MNHEFAPSLLEQTRGTRVRSITGGAPPVMELARDQRVLSITLAEQTYACRASTHFLHHSSCLTLLHPLRGVKGGPNHGSHKIILAIHVSHKIIMPNHISREIKSNNCNIIFNRQCKMCDLLLFGMKRACNPGISNWRTRSVFYWSHPPLLNKWETMPMDWLRIYWVRFIWRPKHRLCLRQQ